MMRSRTHALLLAALVAAAALAACGPGSSLLSPPYEYEEDLTLKLDGSGTLVVNASIPALIALHGLPLNPDPRTRADETRRRLREVYTSPQTQVLRVNTWTKYGRRFVGVRLRIPDIRALPKAAPFAWSSYDLHQEDGHHVLRHTLGAPAPPPGSTPDAGWNGNELVAFRVHLPSRVLFYNARDVDDPSRIRTIDRGNIITWEQRLADRLQNKPIASAEDRAAGVMEIRMDSQSILYRTLWLFALAFTAAVAVLALLIWLALRRGSSEVSPQA
jgi:hypothetical protein